MDDIIRTEIMRTAINLFEDDHGIRQIAEAIVKLYPGVRSTPVVIAAIEMYKSLVQSIDRSGGSGWPTDKLLKMTTMDLISNLATNDIRFVFYKRKGKK